MGLRDGIARGAVRRAHVLVVEVPGWGKARRRAEAEIARRGWAAAGSPADADILLVCGQPGRELASACGRTWSQLPGPRIRVAVIAEAEVAAALDRAAAGLLDDRRQREEARARPVRPDQEPRPDGRMDAVAHDSGGMHGGPGAHGGMDMDMEGGTPAHDSGGMHGDMEMNMDGGGMDMGMDMPMPGGIPLASGGPDRDGLDLDLLHLPLGPVLAHWPAGLVVHCSLQGDVIVSAEAEVLPAAVHPHGGDGVGADGQDSAAGQGSAGQRIAGPGGQNPGWQSDGRREETVRLCDAAVQVLALSGWSFAADRARRIRDAAVHAPLTQVWTELALLARRVERSRLLRWSMNGVLTAGEPSAPLGGTGAGERVPVLGRLLGWLESAARIAGDGPASASSPPDPQHHRALLQQIPALVTGAPLARARLVIAGLGLDTAAIVGSHVHG